MTLLIIIFFVLNCIFLGSCVIFARICFKYLDDSINIHNTICAEKLKITTLIQKYINYEKECANPELQKSDLS